MLKTFPIFRFDVLEQDDLKLPAHAVRLRNEMVEQFEGGMDLGDVTLVDVPILLIRLLTLRAAVIVSSPI